MWRREGQRCAEGRGKGVQKGGAKVCRREGQRCGGGGAKVWRIEREAMVHI